MTEPTKEQRRHFWEWCGAMLLGYCWQMPNGDIIPTQTLSIDLNSLSRWAVPRIVAGDDYTIQIARSKYHTNVYITPHYEGLPSYKYHGEAAEDPALALFWALWQVKEEKK